MDVHDKIDELLATIEGARSMPMSASCVVHRADVLGLIEDVRDSLPAQLQQAEELLRRRDAVLARAEEEAAQIVAEAQAERGRLVAGHEVARDAGELAERRRAAAAQETARMRREAEEYVDRRLAGFEETLERTLATVRRGREKMAERLAEEPREDVGSATPAAEAEATDLARPRHAL